MSKVTETPIYKTGGLCEKLGYLPDIFQQWNTIYVDTVKFS